MYNSNGTLKNPKTSTIINGKTIIYAEVLGRVRQQFKRSASSVPPEQPDDKPFSGLSRSGSGFRDGSHGQSS